MVFMLDREFRDIYEVLIKVFDNGNFFWLIIVFVMVYIVDVNDVVLKFVWFFYDFLILEMVGMNINVGKILVIDDDLGINLKFVFFIVIYWKGLEIYFKVN